MGLAKAYEKWPTVQRNLFLLGSLDVFVALCLLPFLFFDLPGLFVGWLVGSAISLLAYLSIVYMAGAITGSVNEEKRSGRAVGLSVFFGLLRFALYAGGLALSAYLTFRAKNPWLNFWALFAAYVPMPIVLAVETLIGRREDKKVVPPEKVSEAAGEESHD